MELGFDCRVAEGFDDRRAEVGEGCEISYDVPRRGELWVSLQYVGIMTAILEYISLSGQLSGGEFESTNLQST